MIGQRLRACYVEDRKALFHKWEDISYIIQPSMQVGGHAGGVVKNTLGIVEFENGTVAEVPPSKIIFAATDHHEYCYFDKKGD